MFSFRRCFAFACADMRDVCVYCIVLYSVVGVVMETQNTVCGGCGESIGDQGCFVDDNCVPSSATLAECLVQCGFPVQNAGAATLQADRQGNSFIVTPRQSVSTGFAIGAHAAQPFDNHDNIRILLPRHRVGRGIDVDMTGVDGVYIVRATDDSVCRQDVGRVLRNNTVTTRH